MSRRTWDFRLSLKEFTDMKFFAACLLGLTLFADPSFCQPAVLRPETYRHYIDAFNTYDNEIYREFIPNKDSWNFLSANIPLFDCPDKKLEQTYYFRWWTYRKHIKKTPGGFVITEFLPDVPWAGKYNTISCAAGFHIYEGRWLHDQQYINDYARYWFREADNIRTYSFWAADALYNQFLATGDFKLMEELLPALDKNYDAWEKERQDANGLFWQYDGNDGMEMSACGTGYRATINSYMFGEASALAKAGKMTGNNEMAARFQTKASTLKHLVQDSLWDESAAFFKVRPKGLPSGLCKSRELHGYTPWYFDLPDTKYSEAWRCLMDPECFFAPFGPTTLERRAPGFTISYEGHECQWNGPSWPYATSITLTALANLLNNYSQNFISVADYFRLLKIYANSQQLTREDGKTVPWIDENLNPFTGDWISRTRLKTWDNGSWSKDKGGEERGKDYNHSTFCDLIITGLAGLRPQPDNTLIINPLIPAGTWEYFCLDNILYHGKIISIFYDKSGNQYHKGKGFRVLVDGRPATSVPVIQPVKVKID